MKYLLLSLLIGSSVFAQDEKVVHIEVVMECTHQGETKRFNLSISDEEKFSSYKFNIYKDWFTERNLEFFIIDTEDLSDEVEYGIGMKFSGKSTNLSYSKINSSDYLTLDSVMEISDMGDVYNFVDYGFNGKAFVATCKFLAYD